ncbi:hypothetical protein RB195_014156 [Necator americanus]|uniref:CUB domain-containing protein n=1 Tax=Necator americanus TaxID=51031 RepID=A0ABR1DYW4_NECAM
MIAIRTSEKGLGSGTLPLEATGCARGVQAAQSQLVSPSSYPDSITVAGSYYNILCNHPGGLMVNLKF